MIKSFGILTNMTGLRPEALLLQGPDGTLYGTTAAGGGRRAWHSVQIAARMGRDSASSRLFTNSLEGGSPQVGLALSGITLYGTTYDGGTE